MFAEGGCKSVKPFCLSTVPFRARRSMAATALDDRNYFFWWCGSQRSVGIDSRRVQRPVGVRHVLKQQLRVNEAIDRQLSMPGVRSIGIEYQRPTEDTAGILSTLSDFLSPDVHVKTSVTPPSLSFNS